MINYILRGIIYFVVFVLLQILVLNNLHLFRIATPFLYLYFILKFPVGVSQAQVVACSFVTGLVMDAFSNTPGMHAAACTLMGFVREPLIRFFMGKELPEGIYPSYATFGWGGFFRYALSLVVVHHTALFSLESLTFFDPLFLLLRLAASIGLTTVLICTVEAFNLEAQKSGE